MDTNQQETQDTEILETVNHSSKYGSQLTVVEKDFATLFEGSDMKKHLTSLKRKYSSLKVKDVNDTETYEDIKKAISVVRPLRTALEKKRKEVNKEAKTFIDTVNSMGAKIQEEIAKIEDPLWAEREKFETMQKEESERAEKEAKERTDKRVNELIANGIVFTGSWYGINQIQVGIQMIQEMTDEDYADLLSKVKIQNDGNIESKRIADELQEAERLKQEAITAQNKKDREELEAGRLELRGGQLELLGIGITPEYELLIKTANNEEWKIRYEQLKLDKLKEKRNEELRQYIVYIRDYNTMIGLDEETYQKELSGVKQAKIDQEEHDRKEAVKEFDRQQAEIKEREEKQKRDGETIANNAKRYELLGFKYNYRLEYWELTIGKEYEGTFDKKDMLNEPEGQYEEVKLLIETATKKENERIANEENKKILDARYTDRKNELTELGFIQNGENSWHCADIDFGLSTNAFNSIEQSFWDDFIKEAKGKWADFVEKKRLSKLSEEQWFEEYKTALKNVPTPTLTDAGLVSKLNAILNLINQ